MTCKSLLQVSKMKDDNWTRTNITLKSEIGNIWTIKFWNTETSLADKIEENMAVMISNVDVVQF